MRATRLLWLHVAVTATLVAACTEEPAGSEALLAPSFANAAGEQHTVVVNPIANGNGVAATIQEGIDRVAPGGKVLVWPGMYPEALVINKGLTLESIGDGSGPVIIATPGAPPAAIQILTADPVTIRDITLHFSAAVGIGATDIANLTVERVTAVASPLVAGSVIGVVNDARLSGGRARLVVRESFIDGGIPFKNSPTPTFPQIFGIRPVGDVDAVIEHNTVRRTGGACIHIATRGDLGGETNAEVVGNDLDECYPLGRAASLLVGTAFGGTFVPPLNPSNATATGVVSVVGNTIRNSGGSCLPTTGINYEQLSGRIERNRVLSAVAACAFPSVRALPSGIFVGSIRGLPATAAVVRFNDIVGNAHPGLLIARNQTAAIDATCNWWGAATGPTANAWPSGRGDTLAVDGAAATPVFVPFATAPIAGTGATSC